MAPLLTPLNVVTMLGLAVATFLGVYAWQNRAEPGAVPLVVIVVGVNLWLVSDLVRDVLVPAYSTPVLAVVFFLGVTILVAGWAAFAIEFSGYRRRVSRRLAALLAIEPVAVLVLTATYQFHDFWGAFDSTSGEFVAFGPAYWTHAAYSYLLVIGGIALLVSMLWKKQTLYPSQVYIVIVGVLLPWLSDVLVSQRLIPVNVRRVSIVVTVVLLAVALFRHKFLRVAPAAKGPLVENLRDGMFVLDRDGQFAEVNPTARDVLGEEDIEGRDGESFLSGHPAFAEHRETLLTTTAEATFEIEHDDRFFDVQVTPLHDHRDELIARQVQLHDITPQRRRERELERQNERLDRFAAVLSHDLRNPLSVASDRASLALETGDETQMNAVIERLDRMESIIDDVLALAREGQSLETPERVALDDVATGAWNNVETREATLEVDAELAFEADRARLTRLFENLFRNAVEHAGPTVAVTVGSVAVGEGFYVADDGPGIPEDERETVLKHGYTDADGTGLGLAIVHSIAAAHGWEVAVTESDTGGARFEFAFTDGTPVSRSAEAKVTD